MTDTSYESLSTRMHLLEQAVERSAKDGAFQIGQLKQDISDVNQALILQTNVTADLVELFNDARAVVRVLVVAGKVAIWITKVTAAFGALWLGFKGILFIGSQK